MAKQADWFRWYPYRWEQEEWLSTAEIEVVGIYWTLLNKLMIQGTLPNDLQKLAYLVGRNVTLESFTYAWEKYLKSQFVKRTQRWVSTGSEPEDGYWLPLSEAELEQLHKHGERIQNEKLEQIRSLTNRALEVKNAAAKQRAESRFKNEVEKTVGDTSEYDWHSVLKQYPKRLNKVGWDEGIRLLTITITTPEDFARFQAALRAYAAECRGIDKKYVKRLDRFATEWTAYVPDNFVVKPAAVVQQTRIANVENLAETIPGRRILAPGEKPPWEPRVSTTPIQRKIDAEFWTAERKERWWNNQPIGPTTVKEDK